MNPKQLDLTLLDSFVKCTMCNSNYKQPKFLTCLHTFCGSCIKPDSKHEYTCPLCKSVTGIPKEGIDKLPTNELSDILSKLSTIKDSAILQNPKSPLKNNENVTGPPNHAPPLPPPLCQDCLLDEPDIATQYCTQCNFVMCKIDAKAHKRHCSSHKLISTQEIITMDLPSLLSLSSTPSCSYHPTELATSYCNSCQTVLCEACVPPHQRCESIRNISEALGEAHNTLSSFQKQAKLQSEDLARILECLPEKIQNIENVRNTKKFHIESMFDGLVQILEKRKQILVEKIDSFYEAEIDRLNKVEIDLQLNVNSLSNLSTTCTLHCNSQLSSSITSLLPCLENRLRQIIEFATQNGSLSENEPELDAIIDSHTSYLLENVGRIVFKKIPQPEVTITAASLGLTKFKPCCMAVSKENNNILVYDGCNRSVRRLDARGDLIKTFSVRRGAEELLIINSMAISNSFIFLLIQNQNTVRVFSPSGQHFQDLGDDASKDRKFNFGGFGGLATSKDGNLFIADYHNHRVHLYSDDLYFKQMIGAQSEEVGSLKFPVDVAVSNDGQLVILHMGNPCINIYDLYGNFLATFASFTEDQEFISPLKIVVSNSGEILLNNTETIALFTKDKVCLTKIIRNGKDQPSDIVSRDDNIIMVCDKLNSIIQVFQLSSFL
ncbi:E3 ubiquitin-protein ligase TRIM71-like [Oopsacas minuta]|uniref:E3 ubiquitin-protein ligase TRIM71-like n=1 Tax=Oopsacas minuta TaxID=111878 RepID=A0AAV7KRA7_9METZ|nr:E3 ubiquitin-protein ligase TRIM71-like [Oopsacas minuta]